MRKKVSINIGEYYASREPSVVFTLLGSCIAVCLFDPDTEIGGMNHILMPGKPNFKAYDGSARYGINAMELLINAMMGLGAQRKKIVAKIFGGANVIPAISEKMAMGSKITDFVVDFLKNENIRIISRDTGGTCIRKIFFHTDTGEVFLKRRDSLKSKLIALEEQTKIVRIRKEIKKPGDITLFDEKT